MLILITVTVIVHTSDTLVPLILFEPYYFCDIEYKKAQKKYLKESEYIHAHIPSI